MQPQAKDRLNCQMHEVQVPAKFKGAVCAASNDAYAFRLSFPGETLGELRCTSLLRPKSLSERADPLKAPTPLAAFH